MLRHQDVEKDQLTARVIGAGLEVHREMGPGYHEAIYEDCMCIELRRWGIAHERQYTVPVTYKGEPLERNYRLDILVEGRLVLEIKAVEQSHPVHKAQVMSYMKLTNVQLGLLFNFNVPLFRDGISRIVLTQNR
jgi:GxxExxY protein